VTAGDILAFDQVFAARPEAPILVLNTESDEELARQAIAHGAQDYLFKVYINAHWLPRALKFVIECKAIRESHRLIDPARLCLSHVRAESVARSPFDGADSL
jgi:DNA-binding NarL/FixJ family response regulator